MNETVKDRLLLFAEHFGITKSKLERELGISNGYFKQLRHKPSDKILERVYARFPEMNKVWLLCGEGEMLTTSQPSKNQNVVNGSNNTNVNTTNDLLVESLVSQIDYLKSQIEKKDETIKQLIDNLPK